ncbi:MAG: hypothetical protein JWN13_3777 [Betaproteobacteria bacterium]|nr:hypothetical protein [Betaproteobacteria bacterium]
MENRGWGLYQKLRSGISNLRRTAPVSVSAMELALQSQHSCTSGPHHFGSNGGRSNVRAGARTCCAKKERNDSLAHCLTLLSSLQPTRSTRAFIWPPATDSHRGPAALRHSCAAALALGL